MLIIYVEMQRASHDAASPELAWLRRKDSVRDWDFWNEDCADPSLRPDWQKALAFDLRSIVHCRRTQHIVYGDDDLYELARVIFVIACG